MKLNNGVEIPNVGLGTWLIENSRVTNVIKEATKLGYRHIDTAQAYGNEEGVGRGIRECGIPRSELFVTTKVKAEYKDYESVIMSIEESLKKMGLDYLDLVIIHSPQPWNEFRVSSNNYYQENLEVYKALEDEYKKGKIRAIGVSNFKIDDLDNILKHATIKPMVNQVLSHVGSTPFELINYCKKNDILVEAYSPIAHGEASRIKVVCELAEKYNKTFAQICLKYQLQLGLVVLPKATSSLHLKENIDLDFVISDDDMKLLNNALKLDNYGTDDFFPVFKYSQK